MGDEVKLIVNALSNPGLPEGQRKSQIIDIIKKKLSVVSLATLEDLLTAFERAESRDAEPKVVETTGGFLSHLGDHAEVIVYEDGKPVEYMMPSDVFSSAGIDEGSDFVLEVIDSGGVITGRVRPKADPRNDSAEQKLLRAIFGEEAMNDPRDDEFETPDELRSRADPWK